MIFKSYDNKIAYYHVPKNGSRTMIGYLALVKEPDLFINCPQHFHPTEHDGYYELRKRTVIEPPRYPGLYGTFPRASSRIRLAVKRDPVARFVSGFNNRVLHHKKIKKDCTDIHEFIEKFDDYWKAEADVKEHFRPQTDFLGTSQNPYTHVFDVTEMNKVKLLFEETYNRIFPDLRLQQGGNNNKTSLTEIEIMWIKDRYKVDYDNGWC